MLKRYLAWGCGVAFLLALGAWAGLAIEGYEQRNAYAEQAPQERAPTIIEVELVFWTQVLGVGTLLLAFATIVLVWQTRRLAESAVAQSKDMRDSIATAARAADAVTQSAGHMREQAELTRESINLARKEFISTHRPKLRVRGFRMEIPSGGDPIILTFEIVNVGDSDALIHWYSVLFEIPSARNEVVTQECGVSLKAGAPYAAYLERRTTEAEDFELFADEVKISGAVAYTDDNGVTRRTGLVRRYSSPQKRLTRYPDADPDEEYED